MQEGSLTGPELGGDSWKLGAAGPLSSMSSQDSPSSDGLTALSLQHSSQSFSHGGLGLSKGQKQKLPGFLTGQAQIRYSVTSPHSIA